MSNVTTYEMAAIKEIVKGCYDHSPEVSTAQDYACCYCATEVEDIAKACNITVNQAKGVLGSLIKKGLADQHGEEFDFMINLTVKGYDVFKAAR
jgi:DNA-binding MarR family transcriptional regulator